MKEDHHSGVITGLEEFRSLRFYSGRCSSGGKGRAGQSEAQDSGATQDPNTCQAENLVSKTVRIMSIGPSYHVEGARTAAALYMVPT